MAQKEQKSGKKDKKIAKFTLKEKRVKKREKQRKG